MATFCHKCGTQAIDNESVFCNKCGAKLTQNIPEKKNDTCSNCGTKILDKESLFCNKCGAPHSENQPVIDNPIEERPVVTRPVIKKKTCPACGAPLDNENKYYCDSCGAYIRGHDPTNSIQLKKIVTPDNRSPRRKVNAKSPFLAVLLSFFIPGSGQCYTGQWWKGIALFIFACFSAVLCIIVIGIFPLLAIWLYSMYDAYRAANRINGSYVDVDDNYPSQPFISRSGNAGQKDIGKKSGSKFGLAIIGVGFLFLILLMVAIFTSHPEFVNGSLSSGSPSETVITKSPDSMALTINDFPTGWRVLSPPQTTGNYYHSDFVQVQGISSAYTVYQTIQKNSTINDAITSYNQIKAKVTDYKVESVNEGDEGFGYVTQDSAYVIFRKANVITTIQYGEGGIGTLYNTLSISDAQPYADTVASRI
jgi:TM2 domain-containing membrane protein YozV